MRDEAIKTIMIVDDEEFLLDIMVKILKKEGYRTLEAESACEALEIYQEKMSEIDLVLLDVMLPDMNGCIVYSKLKNINPEVRVVYLTGDVNFEPENDEGIPGEDIDLLQKPFEIKELKSVLKRAMT